MLIFGYCVVAAAYSLTFLPDTVVSLVFVVSGGLGTCSAFAFVNGMLFRRVNTKGIVAGYVAGSIPFVLGLIGLFLIPRHKSTLNSTTRNTEYCDLSNGTLLLENSRKHRNKKQF